MVKIRRFLMLVFASLGTYLMQGVALYGMWNGLIVNSMHGAHLPLAAAVALQVVLEYVLPGVTPLDVPPEVDNFVEAFECLRAVGCKAVYHMGLAGFLYLLVRLGTR
jgi:hypothetical protein